MYHTHISEILYPERSLFFFEIMEALQEAGENGYEALQTKCLELEAEITGQYPIPPFKDASELLHLPQDYFSKALMPHRSTRHVSIEMHW